MSTTGMDIKIEIGQYRRVDKGNLRAFFSLLIHPMGQKILDCRYLTMPDGGKWFAFPQKEIKKQDNTKSEYIPLISYANKEYLNKLKEAVLEALKAEDAKVESHGQTGTTNRTIQNESQGKANPLSSQPSVDWFQNF